MTGQYKIQEMVHCVGTGWFFFTSKPKQTFSFFCFVLQDTASVYHIIKP